MAGARLTMHLVDRRELVTPWVSIKSDNCGADRRRDPAAKHNCFAAAPREIIEPPLSTVGECVAQQAISSLPDSYALAVGE